jgi:rare lipoprotein A
MNRTPAHKAILAMIGALLCATPALGAAPAASATTGGTGVGAVSSARSHRHGHRPTPTHTPKLALATWFGPGFYGKQTACGQTMSPVIVGVANRTLPCGTLVQVTYEGRRLTLPVIDRGPYGTGASWDLTAGAAQTLAIEDTVRIATHVVGSAPNTPLLGVPPGAAALEATGGAAAG